MRETTSLEVGASCPQYDTASYMRGVFWCTVEHDRALCVRRMFHVSSSEIARTFETGTANRYLLLLRSIADRNTIPSLF
jgi:hypothetical protein